MRYNKKNNPFHCILIRVFMRPGVVFRSVWKVCGCVWGWGVERGGRVRGQGGWTLLRMQTVVNQPGGTRLVASATATAFPPTQHLYAQHGAFASHPAGSHTHTTTSNRAPRMLLRISSQNSSPKEQSIIVATILISYTLAIPCSILKAGNERRFHVSKIA